MGQYYHNIWVNNNTFNNSGCWAGLGWLGCCLSLGQSVWVEPSGLSGLSGLGLGLAWVWAILSVAGLGLAGLIIWAGFGWVRLTRCLSGSARPSVRAWAGQLGCPSGLGLLGCPLPIAWVTMSGPGLLGWVIGLGSLPASSGSLGSLSVQ